MAGTDERALPEAVPDGIKGWNWGAFWLNWIWGVGNNTYVALLTFVPFVGLLVMPFVLGAKGSEWAWRNGRWDGVEHFRRVQRRWAMWGFAIAVVTSSLIAALLGSVFYALGTSDAYRMGVARLQESREAADLLGAPITAGFPMGSIGTSGQSGQAVLDFSAKGSRAAGRVVLQAVRKAGAWSLTDMRLRVEGREEPVDLLKEERAGTPGASAPSG